MLLTLFNIFGHIHLLLKKHRDMYTLFRIKKTQDDLACQSFAAVFQQDFLK